MKLRLGLGILLVLSLSGCSLVSKKDPAKAPPDVKKQLARAEIDMTAKAYSKALKQLKAITDRHADTDAADDAYIMMGQAYCAMNDYTNCYRSYIAVMDANVYSPREVDASIGAANALQKLGRFDEALSMTNRGLKVSNLSPEAKTRLYELRYQILQQTGDRLETLKALVRLSEDSAKEEQKHRYRIRATEIVESNLSEAELETVATDAGFGSVRAVALFRVGSAYFEQRDYNRAESYLSRLKGIDSNSDLTAQAQLILDQIEARRRVDPLVIGAVLPLTGKYANIGYKTLRGLQLGLGVAGNDSSSFKLAVIDSAGNADTARRAVERLVVEDSAIAIVGDITSKTAEAVAQKSDELGVPVVALSQKSGLTEMGQYVFRNALTSEAIVKELVRSAMVDHGMKRFAILYPNDAYGVEYANLFWNEVREHGGEIRGAQSYAPKGADLRGPIQRLVGDFYLEPRMDEYNYLLKDWYGKQKVITSRNAPPEDLLKPLVDFDAIFIPDNVANLGQVASMLLYQDVDKIRLLGTNLWNSEELVTRGTKLIENSLFVDATSSLGDGFKRTEFYRKFKETFGEEPSVFEAQAYDSALALRQVVVSGARSRTALRDALLGLRSFAGSAGPVSVLQNREFARPLAVLTVTGGQLSIVKPTVSTDKN